MSQSRVLHRLIKARIELALGGRSWNWLAKASGVPHSTLASQAAKPKFSVDVLVRVARALNCDLSYFMPDEGLAKRERSADADVLFRIRSILEGNDRAG